MDVAGVMAAYFPVARVCTAQSREAHGIRILCVQSITCRRHKHRKQIIVHLFDMFHSPFFS